MPTTATHELAVPGATICYDVHEPDRAAGERHRPLLVFGSPMGASGFAQLVDHLDDRTVITFDPRMSERSRLAEGAEVSYPAHADDAHRVVAATGLGPVDVFASSGAAVVVLPWLLEHPGDLGTVVAHEPPLTTVLEDRDVVERITADIVDTYQRSGQGAAMAKFIRFVTHEQVFTEAYLDQPDPDPAHFGLPTEDDGRREDPLLTHNLQMPPYHPDGEALRASSVRIVPAIGEVGGDGLPRRGGRALATMLGVVPVEFPGDHGGFTASEWSPGNDPAAFAERLRSVLAG